MDLSNVLKGDREELKVVTSYVSRNEIWQRLKETGEIQVLLENMKSKFYILKESEKPNDLNKKAGGYGHFLNKWQNWINSISARTLEIGGDEPKDSEDFNCVKILKPYINSKADGVIADVVVILNYLAHAMLDCHNENEIMIIKAQAETSAFVQSRPLKDSLRNQATDEQYSAYCLGGGALGEMINVNKGRAHNENLSLRQRNEARVLLEIGLSLCDEKKSPETNVDSFESETVPAATTNRDSGGLHLPHKKLIIYLKRIMAFVGVHYLKWAKSDETNVIKKTMAILLQDEDLKQMFYSALALIPKFTSQDFTKEIVEMFRLIYLRKLGHALLNDFIFGKNEAKNINDKSRGQGGQLLRDKLFQFSEGKTNSGNTKSCKNIWKDDGSSSQVCVPAKDNITETKSVVKATASATNNIKSSKKRRKADSSASQVPEPAKNDLIQKKCIKNTASATAKIKKRSKDNGCTSQVSVPAKVDLSQVQTSSRGRVIKNSFKNDFMY